MTSRTREFLIDLERDGPQTPWGIRLVGGSDLNTPLIITKVLAGTPAHGRLVRGDVIAKIQEYDARDMRNIDAQNLFRSASNRIRVVVHRDSKMVVASNMRNDGQKSRSPSAIPPYRHDINLLQYDFNEQAEQAALLLPQTNFNAASDNGSSRPNSRISNFSPMPTRDHQQEVLEEQVAITSQPYRTTPLILPGAKVKKEVVPNECYLRHHPNPSMRGRAPHVEENFLRQKHGDNYLNRVVGDTGNKIAHKQFNSPIGLYSDGNIEQTIRSTVPHTTPETYRALQDEQGFGAPRVHEIPITVQHQTYQPAPGRKPQAQAQYQAPPPQNYSNVNALGESNDTIHQSHSFKRLMFSLGEN
ncbi:PDZ and LIM domain protein 3 isoform X3 [Sitodiplosis mosellana]|uniref:PDZ and LIM domain protein 3 isoform X3 n=1 Tax=Sitodiplosis mosellana TaxID=263140 RepID=UPI002443A733|nr:PDZ and LIM domain protein 3 isoform X3 [Sitodiplosis mosellana]